jgi:hypothetical protein
MVQKGAAIGELIHYPQIRVMKDLLYRAILAASLLAASVGCQGQNVYSINGISEDSFLPAPHRPGEVKLASCTYGSGAQGARVEWYVSTNALAKQPHWNSLSAEVPLSPRKACVLALPHVRERLPHVQSWSVESILLRKPYLDLIGAFPDVWWYEITFTPSAPADRAGMDYRVGYYAATQIVLLDGTVVPQTTLKKK